MASFDESLAAMDASLVAERGEPVTYTPKAGAARAVTAEVERLAPDRAVVRFRNHATLGVDPAAVEDHGQDRVTFPRTGPSDPATVTLRLFRPDPDAFPGLAPYATPGSVTLLAGNHNPAAER